MDGRWRGERGENDLPTSLFSRIVIEIGKYDEPNFICAIWILPRIRAVPTPLAKPANLLSIRRVTLHLSAQAADMMVD